MTHSSMRSHPCILKEAILMNIYFIKEVILNYLDIFPLNYFVGLGPGEANSFLPKKELLIKVILDHTYNLQSLACGAGTYVQYKY